jgi:hypothetical protein
MAWTAPATWTTGQVVTAANLNEQIRDNETYIKAHIDASAAVHGLAASVNALGSKQAAALRIEYASANSAATGNGAIASVSVTWTNAFTTVYAVSVFMTVAKGAGGSYAYATYRATAGADALSITAATANFLIGTDAANATVTAYFMAIGT